MCDATDGTCVCLYGYGGERCERMCPPGQAGQRKTPQLSVKSKPKQSFLVSKNVLTQN